MKLFKHLLLFSVVTVATLIVTTGSVLAHVVVKPSEAVTAGYQTFTMSVPNEKDIPTTSVKLVIPADLTSVTPTVKPGWTITSEKTGSGENAVVTSITWSNGMIEPGFRDDFTFSGKVPAKSGQLKWKAYQTYADTTVVAWDKEGAQAEKKIPNSGPLSITEVTAETTETKAITQAEQSATNAQSSANRGFYLGLAGLLSSLFAVYLATSKK